MGFSSLAHTTVGKTGGGFCGVLTSETEEGGVNLEAERCPAVKKETLPLTNNQNQIPPTN